MATKKNVTALFDSCPEPKGTQDVVMCGI